MNQTGDALTLPDGAMCNSLESADESQVERAAQPRSRKPGKTLRPQLTAARRVRRAAL
jgi:hypothetical protein